MNPTPDQLEYFAWCDKGTGNGILQSVAGSGKTTSIIESLNYIEDTDRILLCSFTNLIASELDARVKERDFKNVTSSTLNAVGWAICRDNIPGVRLDKFKTANILHYVLKGDREYKPINDGFDPEELYKVLRYSVNKLVSLAKAYVVTLVEFTDEKIDEISRYHSLDPLDGNGAMITWARDNYNKIVREVYRISIEHTLTCDFDDMKLFPVLYDMKFPKYKWIIVDEAQDCNECDIRLIHKLAENGDPATGSDSTRVIAVGDDKQAIYLFRGALNNALEVIRDRFNAKVMNLSVCWRCPDKVLEVARMTNPMIQGPVPNPRREGIVGWITTEEFLNKVRPGDFVIARTTAPLVKRCLQLIYQNIPAKVKGRDIGEDLLKLIDKIMNRQGLNLKEFIRFVQEYQDKTTQNLAAMGRDEAVIRVTDQCEAILYFCTEADSVQSVKDRIGSLFTDDKDNSRVVLFLSGHKSKGLQNKRVYFLRPDLSPHPKAKTSHDMAQENNIRHIIVTRSEAELYFIEKEKDEK